MDKYINNLINDILNLLNTPTTRQYEFWDVNEVKNNSDSDAVSNAEEYLYGQRLPIQQITKIDKKVLPPPEKLNDHQISILLPYLEKLLMRHNFELAYPGNIDLLTKYELLYKEWEKKHPFVSQGRIGIEFCYYNEKDCPIPGRCNACEQFEKEYEENKQKDLALAQDETLHAKEEIKQLLQKQNEEKIIDTINNFIPSENNILGIYKYCDRWCERCKMTKKCSNFQFDKELDFFGDNADRESKLEDFNALLSSSLKFLHSKIDELDIDIKFIDYEKESLQITTSNNLIQLAKDYALKLKAWFDENLNYLSDVSASLWNKSQEEFNLFNQHIDTIGWYMFMIPVKLNRALGPEENFNNDDRHATCKLVIQNIEHSIESFSILFKKLSQKQNEIIDFLTMLSNLKDGINIEIPEAKNFIRKGIDDQRT